MIAMSNTWHLYQLPSYPFYLGDVAGSVTNHDNKASEMKYLVSQCNYNLHVHFNIVYQVCNSIYV